MQVDKIMSRNVITVGRDASILTAINLMLEHRVSGLPVVDESGALVGILTEGDLLRRGEVGTERRESWWARWLRAPAARAGDYVRAHARLVADLMTTEVQAVSETTPLDEAVDLMESKRVKRLPVLRDQALVGLISRADFLRALADAMSHATADAAGEPDDALERRIIAELGQLDWFSRGQIAIRVDGGVVHLEGCYSDRRERDAVRVAAENTPGVRAVQDHLTFVDPSAAVLYG